MKGGGSGGNLLDIAFNVVGGLIAGAGASQQYYGKASNIDRQISELLETYDHNRRIVRRKGRAVRGRIRTQTAGQGKGVTSGTSLMAMRDAAIMESEVIDNLSREVNNRVGKLRYDQVIARENAKTAIFEGVLSGIFSSKDSIYSALTKPDPTNRDSPFSFPTTTQTHNLEQTSYFLGGTPRRNYVSPLF
jgi:hypothetical protein